jgi:integrase
MASVFKTIDRPATAAKVRKALQSLEKTPVLAKQSELAKEIDVLLQAGKVEQAAKRAKIAPVLHEAWRFKYRDAQNRIKKGTGWSDKQTTLDHARTLEAEARALRKGEKAAPPAWLQNRNKPIAEVIAEYLEWGNAKGGRNGEGWSGVHAGNVRRNLAWWVERLSLYTLADVDLAKVEGALRDLRQHGRDPKHRRKNGQDPKRKLSAKTAVDYGQAIAALCTWSVTRNYLGASPLASLELCKGESEHPNRRLTDEEIGRLLTLASPKHALWYRVALATGYRQNELRSLKVRNLDPFGPSLPLAKKFTKNRKDARQPVTRELAAELEALAKGREKDAPLLEIPSKSVMGELVKADFTVAGIKPFVKNEKGVEEKATFHSFRVNFINAVIESGADLRTVLDLSRHSSASLSLETYGKGSQARQATGAEAAAAAIRQAVAVATRPTEGQRKAAGAEGETVTGTQDNGAHVVNSTANALNVSEENPARFSQVNSRASPLTEIRDGAQQERSGAQTEQSPAFSYENQNAEEQTGAQREQSGNTPELYARPTEGQRRARDLYAIVDKFNRVPECEQSELIAEAEQLPECATAGPNPSQNRPKNDAQTHAIAFSRDRLADNQGNAADAPAGEKNAGNE